MAFREIIPDVSSFFFSYPCLERCRQEHVVHATSGHPVVPGGLYAIVLPGGCENMMDEKSRVSFSKRIMASFVAGFLATLIFHQLMLWILWHAGVAPFAPFAMAATSPFGLPAVLSLSFWGGVWGILFAIAESRFPDRAGYWFTAFLFGAILPSLVALLIVLPLKGRPMGGGWGLPLLTTAFLINGAWGIGTAFFFRLFHKR